MNVERLHAILLALREDLDRTSLVQNVRALRDAMTNLAQNSNPQYQTAVSEALSAVRESIRSSEVDLWPASWRQTLDELGMGDSYGQAALEARIEAIVGANELTPQSAADDLNELVATLDSYYEIVERLLNGFVALRIGQETLEAGQAEVMVTIPRDYVHESLVDLGAELRELNRILGPFEEIVTGERTQLRVRAIASSDYGVYLETAVQVGAFVALGVERVISAYKTILDIRLNRQQLAENGVPESDLAPIDEHARARMTEEIKAYVDEVVEERLTEERSGREHELAMDLRYSLNSIANRLDAGFNFDVRAPEPEPEDDDDADDTQSSTNTAIQQIISVSDTLKYVNRAGGGMLELPESKGQDPRDDNST